VVRTTSYTFRGTNHAANLFALKELGNIYSHIMNPTQAAVEERLAALA
jgi:O-acetylhomoserine (thiol)-lyase